MSERRLVHPRWIWSGLVLAVAGAAVLGAGVAVTTLWVAILGTVLLLVGAAAGVRGGVLYDAHRSATASEIQRLREGGAYEGIAPGDTHDSEAARREARHASATTHAATSGTRAARRPALAGVGAAMLLVAAVFVLFAQTDLYPHTPTGQDNAATDLGLAVVIGLVAVRVLVSAGAHPVAAGLAMAAGVALLLLGILTEHTSGVVAFAEGITGVWVVIGAAVCLGSPSRRRRPQRFDRPDRKES